MSRVDSARSPEWLATLFPIPRAESHGLFFLLRERAIPIPTAAPTAIPIQIAMLGPWPLLVSESITSSLPQCTGAPPPNLPPQISVSCATAHGSPGFG